MLLLDNRGSGGGVVWWVHEIAIFLDFQVYLIFVTNDRILLGFLNQFKESPVVNTAFFFQMSPTLIFYGKLLRS